MAPKYKIPSIFDFYSNSHIHINMYWNSKKVIFDDVFKFTVFHFFQYQIGLDVEFLSKPFGTKETASILQLGTSENNYILVSCNCVASDWWRSSLNYTT